MKLQMVGCSHHSSPVEIRERLAFSQDQAVEALHTFQSQFSDCESVLLSTCNRVEFYVARNDAEDTPTQHDLISFLANFHQLDVRELNQYVFQHADEAAVDHLFMVAASLDSMVVGEAQILSQVKQAFGIAQQAQATGPATHFMFEAANRVAKRVATETKINRRRVSIPSVAVADYARQLFETFKDKKVALLGAGEMGEETLRYLHDEGARDIVILNRNAQRADALAAKLGASADAWENLDKRLAWADLVISTTGASEPIVSVERFEKIEQQREDRLLFVLDLAVPRDFDAKISRFGNVYLYCIDDLKVICDKNRKAREKEWPRAQQIVEEETARFLADQNHRATGPTIQRLRQQADELKTGELQRLLNKLGELDDRSREEIQRSFDRLVNKLLHPPLESLRDEAKKGSHHSLLDALRHLFQISDQE